MNMNTVCNFVEAFINLLFSWLFISEKEQAWCPVVVDNRYDEF